MDLTCPSPTSLHSCKTLRQPCVCLTKCASSVCSLFSLDARELQCSEFSGRIYQAFNNIVCLTTHKHTARKVAQSKQAACSDTQRPLALLKRPTLGPRPGSHTAPFKASPLPGVCQRRADMHKVLAVGLHYELKWQF